MGTIEKRGKSSWRIGAQIKVGDTWQWVRVSLRMDPSLPEAVQRRDAEKELKKLEARLAGRPEITPTLREWSETWLTRHLDQDASPVTVSNYRYLLNSRILPQLGDKPLPDLTPAVLTDWLFNLRKDKRKTTRLPDDLLSRPRRKTEQLAPASSAPLSVKTALKQADGTFSAYSPAPAGCGHGEAVSAQYINEFFAFFSRYFCRFSCC